MTSFGLPLPDVRCPTTRDGGVLAPQGELETTSHLDSKQQQLAIANRYFFNVEPIDWT
jgi:hypothetical protein